jgi:hypothetical protein
MPQPPQDLQRALRRSVQAAPIHAVLLALCALGLWIASRIVAVPLWLAGLLLGLLAFALVGDLVNIVYCRWRLRGRGDA